MSKCDRCRTRPAVCVIGATLLYEDGATKPCGGAERVPLEAGGVLYYGQDEWTDECRQLNSWLEMCAVCSGRL